MERRARWASSIMTQDISVTERVAVVGPQDSLTRLLVSGLRERLQIEVCHLSAPREEAPHSPHDNIHSLALTTSDLKTLIYIPTLPFNNRDVPDLTEAEAVFEECARAGLGKIIVLSSAAIYKPDSHNTGLLSEASLTVRKEDASIGGQWSKFEALAEKHLGSLAETKLTILRPTPVLIQGRTDYFSRLFARPFAVILPGHDPSIQLLSPNDLVEAVGCAIVKSASGVYNVAPDGVIPLRAALRLAGSKRLPLSRLLQRLVRPVLASAGLAAPLEQLEYVRYSWTISNRKIKHELGFIPRRSSAEVLLDFAQANPDRSLAAASGDSATLEFDDFGMDKGYIAAYGRTLFNFLARYYWRIEVDGLGNVPGEGRAVLAGIHRGFMPWDAVMTLHLLARRAGRYPRFLIHPGLIKFPFLFNFHTKLGGVVACRENADYMLEHDQLLGIYPEGIRGAFSLYRDAYRLGKFGRDDYVKIALRNRAPIIPFVTVGSAEIFPIFGKIDWHWWKRVTEWPFFPVTTFPLLPLPLPSKWHIQFLPPLHIEEQYPPEAADDAATVRLISKEVRDQMEEAIQKILSRRKSIFYGSVFRQSES